MLNNDSSPPLDGAVSGSAYRSFPPVKATSSDFSVPSWSRPKLSNPYDVTPTFGRSFGDGGFERPGAAVKASSSGYRTPDSSRKGPVAQREDWYSVRTPCSSGIDCHGELIVDLHHPLPESPSGHAPHAVPTNQLHSAPSASGSSLPSRSALPLGPVSPSGAGRFGGKVNIQLVLSPRGAAAQAGPRKGYSVLSASRHVPSNPYDVAPTFGRSFGDGGIERPGAGLFPDSDLCSDSPISALTALTNGTVLIFKGELFWAVDPVSRSTGHPRRISDTLGVPAPIDTVFTRCNCQGNTYIIKGDQYWRLDQNMVVEPGFPRPLTSEFPGLTGNIEAALTAPATRSRPESIYFFKRALFFSVTVSGDLPALAKPDPSAALTAPPIFSDATATRPENFARARHSYPPNSLRGWLQCS
ncbi:hypothetical protein LDENG_00023940 [Lucifuga dentata]|nr:hypothetical protein LDENG_00023940 [Lucifuga dentata]